MLDTPPPNMEEQDCREPSSITSRRPMPPTINAPFQCRFRKRAVRLDSWAVFLAAFAVASAVFPAWAVLPAARYAAAYCFCSFPFLPQAGDGIGRKLGVLRHGFPIVEIRIGLDRRLLRLCRVPPGFQLAFRPPVLDTAVSVAHSLLKATFPQVARLDAGIFLLHLSDLAVDGCACLLDGAGQRIGMLGDGSLDGTAVFAASSRSAALSDLRMAPCSSGLAWSASENCNRRMDGPLPPRPPDRFCAVSGASSWLLPVPGAVPHDPLLSQRHPPCRRRRNGPAPASGQRDRSSRP